MPGFTFPFNLVGWAVWSVLLRTESLVSQFLFSGWINDWNLFQLWFLKPNSKFVQNLSWMCKKLFLQEEVESATAVVSHEEDIVWTQLLLGSVYGMGQVVFFNALLGFVEVSKRYPPGFWGSLPPVFNPLLHWRCHLFPYHCHCPVPWVPLGLLCCPWGEIFLWPTKYISLTNNIWQKKSCWRTKSE